MTRETTTPTDLDPVIHVPVQLRLMVVLTALAAGDTISFSRLQGLLDLTPGNLITHLRKLEEAGYVETTKSGRVTTAHGTAAGGRRSRRTGGIWRRFWGPEGPAARRAVRAPVRPGRRARR